MELFGSIDHRSHTFSSESLVDDNALYASAIPNSMCPTKFTARQGAGRSLLFFSTYGVLPPDVSSLSIFQGCHQVWSQGGKR
jgi:hypothetical protein